MKTRVTTKTEKGNKTNVQQTINLLSAPENYEELVTLIDSDEALKVRAYLLLIQAVDGHVKLNLPEGTHTLEWIEAVKRSGRRTQDGLNSALVALMVEASTLAASGIVEAAMLIPKVLTLQTLANKSFKGEVDNYYGQFYALKSELENLTD